MFERTQYSYAPETGRLALVTGAETVAIWQIDGEDAPFALETSRSRLEGVAFVGPDRLLTVHQLGECVIWQLPAAGEVPDQTEDVPQTTDGDGEGEVQTGMPIVEGDAAPREAWTDEIAVDICCFAAGRDGRGYTRSAAAGGRDGALVLFDLGGETPTFARADAHDGNVTELTFDPHGDRLASGGRDRQIVLWSTDPDTFQPLEQTTSETRTSAAQADGDDTTAADETAAEADSQAADGNDTTAATVEPTAEYALRQLNVLEGSQGWPLAIAFSRDETRIATTSLDNGLYLWDPAADDPLLGVVNRHDNWVTELAFAPDDTCVATGSWDTTAHIFETQSLEPQFRFEAHSDFVSAVAFVPETDLLVTTGYDGRLAIWNWQDGSLLHSIEAHPDWIEALVILEDGRGLTMSSEEIVRLWDLENGEKLDELGDTTFEGFELGRNVDFSKYVEVPELSSDELAEERDPVPKLDAVHNYGQKADPESDDGPGQTAVGLLEEAIDEPTSTSADQFEKTAGEGDPAGTAMLESKLDETDASPDQATADPAPGDAPDDPGEIDVAFAEISDAESDEADEADDTGADREAEQQADAETEGTSEGDDEEASLLDDEDFQASIENVGEAIDEKRDEESFDVSADLDEPDQSADEFDAPEDVDLSDEGPAPGETDDVDADEDLEPSADDSPDDPDGDNDPQLGGDPSPQMGSPVNDGPEVPEPSDAAPGTPEPESTLQGAPEPANADAPDPDDQEAGGMDPNSTLVGTPEKHTADHSDDRQTATDDDATDDETTDDETTDDETTDDETTDDEAQTGGTVGGRLSAPSELGDVDETAPEDIPEPETDGESPDRSFGVESSDSPESDEPDTSGADAESLADEPTDELEAIDTSDESPDAPDKSTDKSDDSSDDSGASPHELKSKLQKLREKKKGSPPEPPTPKLVEVGMANIWETRPSPSADRSDTTPLASTDESTADGDFELDEAFRTSHERVMAVTPHPHSGLLVTCGDDGTACIWTSDGDPRLELPAEGTSLHDVIVTPDARVLAAAADNGAIYLWLLPDSFDNVDDAIPYTRLDAHEGSVNGLDVDPTGQFLVSGSDDGTARIWSLIDGACMVELEDHAGAVRDASWGQFPVTAGEDGSVRYWDQEGRMINETTGAEAITQVATLGQNTGWTTAGGRTLLQTGSRASRLQAPKPTATNLAFGIESTLAVATSDGQVELYPDGAEAPTERLDSETPVLSLFMRRNVLAAGGDDGRVYLYRRD
jgi:WD40 repeat protein